MILVFNFGFGQGGQEFFSGFQTRSDQLGQFSEKRAFFFFVDPFVNGSLGMGVGHSLFAQIVRKSQ